MMMRPNISYIVAVALRYYLPLSPYLATRPDTAGKPLQLEPLPHPRSFSAVKLLKECGHLRALMGVGESLETALQAWLQYLRDPSRTHALLAARVAAELASNDGGRDALQVRGW